MRKLPRVLIVEDEPAIAELIAVNLRHNGFQPFWAEDGESAQRELSDEAGVMEPTTFTAVKAMEKMGFIWRTVWMG